jgi:DNA-directed RNA polymerase subunit RPC12/RpoP
VHVQEPIYLCSSCRAVYRRAGFKLQPLISDQSKGMCEWCNDDPEAIVYLIERSETIPHCPRCRKRLIKTQTLVDTYYSCPCGYEVMVET